MNTNYIIKNRNEIIIGIVHSIMNDKTGKVETITEHTIIKLMQIKNVSTISFKYGQNLVNFYYSQWIKGEEYND